MKTESLKKDNTKDNDSLTYLIILAVIFIVFKFILNPVQVQGHSMDTTFHDKEFAISLCHADINKGDVVICKTNLPEKMLIKRVIAGPGDTIDIDFETGTVKVNDEILSESYIKEPTYTDEGGWTYPMTVPENSYFVMGDNRNNSLDSRSSQVGCINKKNIKGKVIFSFSKNPFGFAIEN